jgi:hypothetical protein
MKRRELYRGYRNTLVIKLTRMHYTIVAGHPFRCRRVPLHWRGCSPPGPLGGEQERKASDSRGQSDFSPYISIIGSLSFHVGAKYISQR